MATFIVEFAGFLWHVCIFGGLVLLKLGAWTHWQCRRTAAITRIPTSDVWLRFTHAFRCELLGDWNASERLMTPNLLNKAQRAEFMMGIGVWLIVGGLLLVLLKTILLEMS